MIAIKIYNPRTKQIFDMQCADFNATTFRNKTNVTKYKYENSHYSINLEGITLSKEDLRHKPMELEFEMMNLEPKKLEEFKLFVREQDARFIMLIEKEENKFYVFVKRKSDTIEPLNTTNYETFKLKMFTESHFIKNYTVRRELETTTPSGVDYPYNYSLLYGASGNSLDFFKVDLPTNKGDRNAYIKVTMFSPNGSSINPKYGLNNKWDATNEAYSAEGVTISQNEKIVVDGAPGSKSILLYNQNNVPTNVEQLRTRTKQPYVTLPPKTTNYLVFTNVTKVEIQVYEQYTNI